MIKRMSAKEARDRFAEVLGHVHYGKTTVIVEKQGKPMVAVIDVEWYERLTKAWEESFGVLDRIRKKNRDRGIERIEEDVAGAVAEVRARRPPKARKRA